MLTTTRKPRLSSTLILGFILLKRKIQDQTISLKHISTKKMITDPLTKGLPPSVFREHLTSMDLRESL
jgi:hypothetical protein